MAILAAKELSRKIYRVARFDCDVCAFAWPASFLSSEGGLCPWREDGLFSTLLIESGDGSLCGESTAAVIDSSFMFGTVTFVVIIRIGKKENTKMRL